MCLVVLYVCLKCYPANELAPLYCNFIGASTKARAELSEAKIHKSTYMYGNSLAEEHSSEKGGNDCNSPLQTNTTFVEVDLTLICYLADFNHSGVCLFLSNLLCKTHSTNIDRAHATVRGMLKYIPPANR